jgi:MtaA/CmuA family methyltransferase
MIIISDPTSSANMLSKKHWEDWGMPFTKRLVRVIKPHGVKTILHVCGNTEDRFQSLASTGVDCLSLDEAVDFEKARKVLGPDYCLMGNVSTTLMSLGTPEDVEEVTKEVIRKAGRLIVSGGCELGETCKPENMMAMVRAAKETPI